MNEMNLRGVDLNLLVIVHQVLRSASTTEAARELHMSQPAVSHALSRARTLFGDPLVVRAGKAMTRTARALEIQSRVDSLLSEIAELLQPDVFRPREAAGNIRVNATEGAVMAFLSGTLAEVAADAPQLQVTVSSDMSIPYTSLRTSDVDLILDVLEEPPSSEFNVQSLYSDALVCVFADAGGSPARDAGSYYSRGQVSVTGGTDKFITRQLHQKGVSRNISIQVPGFMAAAEIVSNSSLFMLIPQRLAEKACNMYSLNYEPLWTPIPSVSLSMVWHNRQDTNPLHRWFRQRIAGSVPARVPAPAPAPAESAGP